MILNILFTIMAIGLIVLRIILLLISAEIRRLEDMLARDNLMRNKRRVDERREG